MVPEKARGELFRYDAVGNLYETGEGAEERVYGQGNRLLRKGEWQYAWDQDGRLTEKRRSDPASGQDEVWRYRWDAAGLLKEVERPDGLRVAFAYDAFARRLSKRVTRSGTTKPDRVFVSETRFVWDGDVLVHEIESRAREDGDPVVEERTYWFEDDGFAPVAHREKRLDDVGRDGGGWFHYVNDPIGTPERLVDRRGEVACELTRSAWGKTETRPGEKASTPIRFQGQYEDEETGLRYNRFRYYDAEAGRFTSVDPFGLSGALHPFAYAPNPFAWVDPAGLARVLGPNETLNRLMMPKDGVFPISPEGGAPNANQKGVRTCTSIQKGGKSKPDVMVNSPNDMVGPDHTPDQGLSGSTIPLDPMRPGQVNASVKVSELPPGLVAVNDHGDHVSLQPATNMTQAAYQAKLNQVPWK
jgi:RHS repeat-associated protein